MTFRWTDEASDLLRQYHAEGRTFTEIAALINAATRLGLTTRNACIGRAHRMGLVSDNLGTQGARKLAARGITVAPKPVVRAKQKPRVKVPPHPFEPKRKPMAEQVAEIVFLAPAGGLTFMQQKDGFCRWPLTAETDFASFRVCGCLCKMTQPYCDEHTARAYQGPRARPPRDPAPVRRNTSEMFFKDWA
jgi:hypothetical protein